MSKCFKTYEISDLAILFVKTINNLKCFAANFDTLESYFGVSMTFYHYNKEEVPVNCLMKDSFFTYIKSKHNFKFV